VYIVTARLDTGTRGSRDIPTCEKRNGPPLPPSVEGGPDEAYAETTDAFADKLITVLASPHMTFPLGPESEFLDFGSGYGKLVFHMAFRMKVSAPVACPATCVAACRDACVPHCPDACADDYSSPMLCSVPPRASRSSGVGMRPACICRSWCCVSTPLGPGGRLLAYSWSCPPR